MWKELADSDSLWKELLELRTSLVSQLPKSPKMGWKALYREYDALGFDSSACGKFVSLTDTDLVATKAEDHRYATVLGKKRLTADSVPPYGYYWEISVVNMQLSGCLCVGVVNTRDAINFPSESHGMFGHYPHGWGLFSDGERCHNACWYRPAFTPFSTGDKVGVLVQFIEEDERELADNASTKGNKTARISFVVNGVNQGVAFRGLQGPLYPAFAIKRKQEVIKLLPEATIKFLLEPPPSWGPNTTTGAVSQAAASCP
jgi:hypothetical protein